MLGYWFSLISNVRHATTEYNHVYIQNVLASSFSNPYSALRTTFSKFLFFFLQPLYLLILTWNLFYRSPDPFLSFPFQYFIQPVFPSQSTTTIPVISSYPPSQNMPIFYPPPSTPYLRSQHIPACPIPTILPFSDPYKHL